MMDEVMYDMLTILNSGLEMSDFLSDNCYKCSKSNSCRMKKHLEDKSLFSKVPLWVAVEVGYKMMDRLEEEVEFGHLCKKFRPFEDKEPEPEIDYGYNENQLRLF